MVLLPPPKRNGATGLKHSMQTQFDCSINVGWVPSSSHLFLVCKAKNANNGTSKEHLDLGSYTHEPRLNEILIDKNGQKKDVFRLINESSCIEKPKGKSNFLQFSAHSV